MLKKIHIHTPIGTMIAIADEHALCLLEFTERTALDTQINYLLNKYNQTTLSNGNTIPFESIQTELAQYFSGTLKVFQTPVNPVGTCFQRGVWQTLQKIAYGKTISYLEESRALGQPNAFRAVASANARNPLAIIIPCHRVIRHDKTLGGYAAGLERKTWLLEHERRYA